MLRMFLQAADLKRLNCEHKLMCEWACSTRVNRMPVGLERRVMNGLHKSRPT